MIIIGTRSTLLKSETVSEVCPNCKADNSLIMNVYQQYGTIFFIPFFPVSKRGDLKCTHCNQVFQLHQMPMWARLKYENLKINLKPRPWHFTGLFLAALCAIAIFIGLYQNNKRISSFVQTPKINDVFEVKINDTVYTLYKIKKIEGNTVYFSPSKFQTDLVGGLDDLAKKEYNASKTYGITKTELVAMGKAGKILEVDRK